METTKKKVVKKKVVKKKVVKQKVATKPAPAAKKADPQVELQAKVKAAQAKMDKAQEAKEKASAAHKEAQGELDAAVRAAATPVNQADMIKKAQAVSAESSANDNAKAKAVAKVLGLTGAAK